MHAEKKENKFYPVTLELARSKNPQSEYWSLMSFEFERRAAITIQRAFYQYLTQKHQLKRKKKEPTHFFNYSLGHPTAIGCIVEEASNKVEEHSQRIKQNHWLELDFNDPYFQSNLHKAVRLNLISCAEMSTALKLYWALYAFRNIPSGTPPRITMHDFLSPGPFDIKTIPYSSKAKAEKFNEKLASLSENNRCYFNIPFSDYMEVSFIYFFLKKCESLPELKLQKKHIFLLTEYVKKMNIDSIDKEIWLEILSNPSKEDLNQLKELILNNQQYFSINDNDLIRDADSVNFLVSIFMLNQGMPGITISPTDGTLSMIVFTDFAIMALSEAMHGSQHATKFFYTTGAFSLRVLREQAERGYRPIETVHDNITETQIIHAFLVTKFIHHYHDLVHAWRCAAIMHKDWIIYITKKLSMVKNFYMSKAIYQLMDMDKHGHELRTILEKIKNLTNISQSLKTNIENLYLKYIWSIIGMSLHSKGISDDKEDHNLIILIDMIQNDKNWYNFFNSNSINQILIKFIPALDSNKPYYEFLFSKTPQIQPTLLKIKKLITENPSKDILSLILTYRTGDSCFVDRVINFLNHFSIRLEYLLKWHRNEGIYFTHSKKDLEKLNPFQIINELSGAFSAYFEKNLQHPTKELHLVKSNMVSGCYELCVYHMCFLTKYQTSFHIKSIEMIAFNIESLTYFFLVINRNKRTSIHDLKNWNREMVIWNPLSGSISNNTSLFNPSLVHSTSDEKEAICPQGLKIEFARH